MIRLCYVISFSFLFCFLGKTQGLRKITESYGDSYGSGYMIQLSENSESIFGLWEYWYYNEQKKSEEIYDTSGTVKYVNFWLPDGTQICKNGQGIIFELWKYRLNDSTIFQVKDSLLNGHFTSYVLEKGRYKMISSGNCKNGKRFGAETTYYNSGQVYFIEEYINDIQNGLTIEFWRNGKVKEQGNYYQNRHIGEWQYFDSSGNKIKLEFYSQKGYRSGKYVEYFSSGKTRIEGEYKVVINRDPQPKQPKTNGPFRRGKAPYKSVKNGIWIYYSVKGRMIKKELYKEGKLVTKYNIN